MRVLVSNSLSFPHMSLRWCNEFDDGHPIEIKTIPG